MEKFHRVRILDDAFVNAAYIAAQYFAHKRYVIIILLKTVI